MDQPLPPWPATPPTHGSVVLREFTDEDAHLAFELAQVQYVPLIGSLPSDPTTEDALAWVRRQRGRLAEGIGLSFAGGLASGRRPPPTTGTWSWCSGSGKVLGCGSR